ncbi:hypothetical protein EYF80_023567 [Liparis tanakae]|uniref:Uncharacterized protein n=1 Tax=Liparis tanakae TaxID=230148 RepID=A0A4Z2HK85_9TELE|nr:hypothetical protein EYF80_023567 [Liparis tanakae]
MEDGGRGWGLCNVLPSDTRNNINRALGDDCTASLSGDGNVSGGREDGGAVTHLTEVKLSPARLHINSAACPQDCMRSNH